MPTSASTFQKLKALKKRIVECRGYRIAQRNRALKLTYHVFLANHRELEGLLLKLCDPNFASEIFGNENRDAATNFGIELNRLFHNYIASAISVVDHIEKPIKELYKKTAFLTEYESKKDSTFLSPFCCFVKELRNYFLHEGIPPTSLEAPECKEANEPWTNVILDKTLLLNHKTWGPQSREFLRSAPNTIDLRMMINSYTDTVESFYIWLSQRQLEINAQPYRELEILEDQLESLLPKDRKDS